nr:GNAT family N-acetyltransferase [Rhodopirellula europaea]
MADIPSPDPTPIVNAPPVSPPGQSLSMDEVTVRQSTPLDAEAIHALMRPFVSQHLLLSRTEAEIIELTRHGFVAMVGPRCIGFAAIEVYSPKLAELQCLAVHPEAQRLGLGRKLVGHCIERARTLGVMEILAISSSEDFLKSCGFDYSLPDQKKALFCQLRPRNFDDN